MIHTLESLSTCQSKCCSFLTQSCDLPSKIANEEAIKATASTITDFIEILQIKGENCNQRKEFLLLKIKQAEDSLQPFINAIELEGGWLIWLVFER